jgi:RHS repeat-associated protein
VNRLGSATETNVDGTSTYWLRGFQYDQYGNMWTSVNGGVPTWSMMPTSNVFNSANQIAGGSYDGAGNQTAIGPYTLQYDAENRLIQASQPTSAGGGQVQYGYDAEGKRITKSFLSGPSTVYVYDVFGSLAAEYSSAPLTTAPVCGTCYLSTDHLGSTRLVTGENGSVMARHDYLPFGEEIPSGYANRGADWAADDSVKQKFTGQERDSETGNDFFNARYFNGALGRFLSPDPGNAGADLMNPQSWNGYAYVQDNPLNRTDPSGFCDVFVAGITMNPGEDSTVDQFSANMIAVFPFSGTQLGSGLAAILSNPGGVAATTAGIRSAIAQTPPGENVNLFGFSGGSEEIASSYSELSPAERNRIGNITYMMPGNIHFLSGLPTGAGTTTFIRGTGVDRWAVPSAYPNGPFNDVASNCGHSASCVIREQSKRLKRLSGSSCGTHEIKTQTSVPLPPPPPQLNPGLGGLFDGWNEFDFLQLIFGQQGTAASTITYH